MTGTPERTAPSFIQRMQEQLTQISSQTVIELAIYFVIALGTGFILKKMFRYIIVALITIVLLLWALDYFNIATVDIAKIKLLMGIDPQASAQVLVRQAIAWMQAHPLLALAIIIGLLLGLSIG